MNAARQKLRAAERAKRSLHKKFADRQWFRGVGIVPAVDGLALRLNVDPSVAVENAIPETYYNFPVEVVEIGGYEVRPRPASARKPRGS